MGRTKQPFERPKPFRDSNLIVIATEGAQTEKQYFETLISKDFYFNQRVRVIIIPNNSNKSSPAWILDNLIKYKEENLPDEDDKLYLVIDKDRWPVQELANVSQQCIQNKFGFIVSNPCFELWIILHLIDLSRINKHEQNLYFENKKVKSKRTYIASKIIEKIGSYT